MANLDSATYTSIINKALTQCRNTTSASGRMNDGRAQEAGRSGGTNPWTNMPQDQAHLFAFNILQGLQSQGVTDLNDVMTLAQQNLPSGTSQL